MSDEETPVPGGESPCGSGGSRAGDPVEGRGEDRGEDRSGDRPEGRAEAAREFAATLDELEARRREVEERFLERLGGTDERIDAVARAADAAREAARQRADRRRETAAELERRLEALQERVAGSSRVSGPGTVERPAWPEGRGGLRRRINRWLRWLLRDYLEVLDRRADAQEGRTGAMEPLVEGLVEGLREVAREIGRSADAVDDAAREVSRRTVEALAVLASVQELVRPIVDAKDAELLERVTEGPLRRTDLILDELARQQEALLAELVDRARDDRRE